MELGIKRKIEAVGVPLREWGINIYRGILKGCNDAFVIDGNKREEILANCQTEDERIRTDKIIRPILRGRDIKRYNYEFADLWLINTHNGIKKDGISRINIDNYPSLKSHLDKYWDDLFIRADKGDTPYNLRNCAYMDDFNRQKIVWKRIGSILRFAYDNDGLYPLDSTCFATGAHIVFLVAFLNSNLGHYLLKDAPRTGTGDLLISVQAIEPLKIPIPNEMLESTVNHMFSKGKYDDLEQLFYEMYNLDEEEIEWIKAYKL